MNYQSLSQQAASFVLALVLLTDAAHAQFGELTAGPMALAAPVSGIRVDGDLSDWPEDMQRFALMNEFGAYGRTDLEGVDLTSSHDLNATMMVGYDNDEDMLYVGVAVYDDRLYMEGDPIHRDGIEIYVSDLSAGSAPVQHRIATSRNNPMSGTGGRWRNGGDHLSYEWRGAVLNSARQPVQLNEGTVLGFDVVAVDNDGHGNTAWVPWGPPVPGKFGGNDRVGRVLLAPSGLAAGEMQKLSTVLGAFHRGHEHGLQALEDHEDELERMVERLAERNAGEAGRHAAVFAARLASQIASAASASAIASAEASIAQIGAPPPPPMPTMVSVTSHSDDDGSMARHIISILGGCAIILAIGFTVSLIRRSGRGGDDDGGAGATALEDRIAQIEARMTDTQDVMIALSEKLDRIDERGDKGDAT